MNSAIPPLPVVIDPLMMGGQPCIRGHRLPVAGLLAQYAVDRPSTLAAAIARALKAKP